MQHLVFLATTTYTCNNIRTIILCYYHCLRMPSFKTATSFQPFILAILLLEQRLIVKIVPWGITYAVRIHTIFCRGKLITQRRNHLLHNLPLSESSCYITSDKRNG